MSKFNTTCFDENDTDDRALVHASQIGDVAAFEKLVGRYESKLFKIAHRFTRNQEDSQDVVQEVFLNAFQHLGQFRGDAKFSTWLVRITLNQSLMKLRKLQGIREVTIDNSFNNFQSDEDKFPIDVPDSAPDPEQLYRAAELREILHKTLQELDPSLRMAYVLRYIRGLSLEQAAGVLDLSASAVKARSFRARLKLREILPR